MKVVFSVVTILLVATKLDAKHCTGACQEADENARMPFVMQLKIEDHKRCVAEGKCPVMAKALQNAPCSDGKAGEYDCNNVDLLSFVPNVELGPNCGNLNDIWGWTDPETGKEYAIVGCAGGTSFVDVSEPIEAVVVGFLPTATFSSQWRDIKVYADHAFIGSEAANHGMQVYDLTQLRRMERSQSGVNILKADNVYEEFGSSHNIVINEESGYAYSVGSRTCTSGLHVVNIRDPLNPQFGGCFGQDGYVHDAQCVNYKGPDQRFQNREICFCYNENTLTIVDVEDKDDMKILSRVPYENNYYTHQGWLNEEQTHLLLDDELDELYGPEPRTRTLIWDVEDLDDPKLINTYLSEKQASDHNLYIKGKRAYQANYCAGLRVLDTTNIETGELREIGYFDVDPDCDNPGFRGSWSSYPYFTSGTIVLSSIERGLFVLKFTGDDN